MRSLKTTLIGSQLAGLTMMIAALAMAPATAQVSPDALCPAGYWHYGSLCINNATGDVVLASAAPEAFAEPSCRRGYWRMDSVCFNLATGDVELVEATSQSTPAGK